MGPFYVLFPFCVECRLEYFDKIVNVLEDLLQVIDLDSF